MLEAGGQTPGAIKLYADAIKIVEDSGEGRSCRGGGGRGSVREYVGGWGGEGGVSLNMNAPGLCAVSKSVYHSACILFRRCVHVCKLSSYQCAHPRHRCHTPNTPSVSLPRHPAHPNR
jgi:hypothetical protein